VPALPDIKAHGKTLKETKALAKKAVEKYIEALRANDLVPDTNAHLMDETLARMARNSQIGM
jgi:predicted RNase H-like HicB family nuclease